MRFTHQTIGAFAVSLLLVSGCGPSQAELEARYAQATAIYDSEMLELDRLNSELASCKESAEKFASEMKATVQKEQDRVRAEFEASVKTASPDKLDAIFKANEATREVFAKHWKEVNEEISKFNAENEIKMAALRTAIEKQLELVNKAKSMKDSYRAP